MVNILLVYIEFAKIIQYQSKVRTHVFLYFHCIHLVVQGLEGINTVHIHV